MTYLGHGNDKGILQIIKNLILGEEARQKGRLF